LTFDDDAAFLKWVEAVRVVGDVCRQRLFGVNKVQQAWPHERQTLPDGDQF
jgi:hypothetical protein